MHQCLGIPWIRGSNNTRCARTKNRTCLALQITPSVSCSTHPHVLSCSPAPSLINRGYDERGGILSRRMHSSRSESIFEPKPWQLEDNTQKRLMSNGKLCAAIVKPWLFTDACRCIRTELLVAAVHPQQAPSDEKPSVRLLVRTTARQKRHTQKVP